MNSPARASPRASPRTPVSPQSPRAHEASRSLRASVFERLHPTCFGSVTLSACSKIGARERNEDRVLVVPSVYGDPRVHMFCVLDGLLGDGAAIAASEKLLTFIAETAEFREALERSEYEGFANQTVQKILGAAFVRGFADADADVLARVASPLVAASGCVAVLAGGALAVAHVGDALCALGVESSGSGGVTLQGRFLSAAHRPDSASERLRAEEAGGAVVFVRGAAHLRGSDFHEKQLQGIAPSQLPTSRGFGGRDLKGAGFSCEPDVTSIRVDASVRFAVIASSGLWEAVTVDDAMRVINEGVRDGADPANKLVDYALTKSTQNVSAVVVVFQ